MTDERTSAAPAVAGLLVSMASVQSGASIAKTLFPLAGVGPTIALRVGFGAVLLCLAMRPWRLRVRRGAWPPLLVYGVSLGVMNFLFYQALARLPIGIAVAVEFIGPLSLAVLTSRRAADFLWVVLAGAGLALLLPLLHQTNVSPTGILYALGAAACWALYIVSGRQVGRGTGPSAVALGSLIAAVLIVPAGLLGSPALSLAPAVLLRGLAVAALSTALPYSLEMIALSRLPTRTFSVLMSLEPAIGALCGLAFLGESLRPAQWLAILLIIAASIGTATTAHQEPAAPVPD